MVYDILKCNAIFTGSFITVVSGLVPYYETMTEPSLSASAYGTRTKGVPAPSYPRRDAAVAVAAVMSSGGRGASAYRLRALALLALALLSLALPLAGARPAAGAEPGRLQWDQLSANEVAYTTNGTISRAQVSQHQTRASMWVVVDSLWVVNVTKFLPNHPGQDAILKATLDSNFSFVYGKEVSTQATPVT